MAFGDAFNVKRIVLTICIRVLNYTFEKQLKQSCCNCSAQWLKRRGNTWKNTPMRPAIEPSGFQQKPGPIERIGFQHLTLVLRANRAQFQCPGASQRKGLACLFGHLHVEGF